MKIKAVFVTAALLFPVYAQALTVRVDCTSGRSINRILRNAPARPLIIELRGTCVENVRITRHDVTLRGSDPATDGVRATSSAIGTVVVDVDEARNVVVENLTLSGGFVGLSLKHAADARVSHAHLTGNRSLGAEVRSGATALFEDTTIDENQFGALVIGEVASNALCRRCTVRSSLDPFGGSTEAIFVSGRLYVFDSTISGPIALQVSGGAAVAGAFDTNVAGTVLAQAGGDASLTGGTLDGMFHVDHARLGLHGVAQMAVSRNSVTNNGYVQFESWHGTDTSIPGTTDFDRFSSASVGGATFGDLVCRSGADVWCTPGTVVTSSSCGRCPRP